MMMAESPKWRQGEIWLVTFYPNIGDEIGKKRPAIIVNDNKTGKLQLVTVVPLTNWNDNFTNYPWMIRIEPNEINNLTKTSAIDCFQVKNISNKRLIKRVGTIDTILLYKVHQTIVKTFDFRYKLCY